MLTVRSVGKSKTAPVLLTAETPEGEVVRYGITEGDYLALGRPAVGDVLEGETEERLLAMHETHGALLAAVRILSFADNNAEGLRRKLIARGYSSGAAEYAVSEVIRRGYLREGDILERAILAAAKKLWGPRRIVEALAAKGYRRAEIQSTLSRLREEGEIDFEASRRRLLEGRLRDEPPEKKRAFLYRYGY